LRFVHVSEVASFLASYQRYAVRPLMRVEKDRYLAEVAVVAEMLGATDVPRSVEELRSYQRAIEPELVRTDQADDALQFLERATSSDPVDVVAHRVIIASATELLPEAVRFLIAGRPSSLAERALVRTSATGFAVAVRWAVGPSVVRAMAIDRIAAI
jgi:uncharacterized protein (DUF2236 family)